jgi:hypothetical protein
VRATRTAGAHVEETKLGIANGHHIDRVQALATVVCDGVVYVRLRVRRVGPGRARGT